MNERTHDHPDIEGEDSVSRPPAPDVDRPPEEEEPQPPPDVDRRHSPPAEKEIDRPDSGLSADLRRRYHDAVSEE